ncbi:hypothetical protein LVB87_12950 [Lysobacter sp. KIS68-7]|uniref:helix-turn-helix transcriptional regulator n=1 Tax=Lysobacter sp. KIS68-7 TaxID=2904252 RepID=UPI001E4901E5|nr:hypothetical protein [Lysobacter sp. KIS68-7]UHQ19082.1 hypothetical protein LVB87_12950 [Lysobacter sp. KIS68-7]
MILFADILSGSRFEMRVFCFARRNTHRYVMQSLPEYGFVRLSQIIGRCEVTQEKADANRASGKGRQRACSGIAPIIPLSATAWWRGVKSGRFPKPIKQGKSTLWNVAEIRDLVERLASNDAEAHR